MIFRNFSTSISDSQEPLLGTYLVNSETSVDWVVDSSDENSETMRRTTRGESD